MSLLDDVPILKRILDIGYAMLVVIILSALVGLILAFPVMWLWNFVFGAVYRINVFQAWAMNVLAGILFNRSGESKK